jgi:hypothetical protein
MTERELRETVLHFRDEAALHAEGLLLTLVGIHATPQLEPDAVVLQVAHELVNGDVVRSRP